MAERRVARECAKPWAAVGGEGRREGRAERRYGGIKSCQSPRSLLSCILQRGDGGGGKFGWRVRLPQRYSSTSAAGAGAAGEKEKMSNAFRLDRRRELPPSPNLPSSNDGAAIVSVHSAADIAITDTLWKATTAVGAPLARIAQACHQRRRR